MGCSCFLRFVVGAPFDTVGGACECLTVGALELTAAATTLGCDGVGFSFETTTLAGAAVVVADFLCAINDPGIFVTDGEGGATGGGGVERTFFVCDELGLSKAETASGMVAALGFASSPEKSIIMWL